MPKESIGLLGVGLLGTALAERLLGAGFGVFGFDADPAACDRIRDLGGRSAATAQQVVRECRRTIFSLPDSDIVASVLDEIGSALQPGDVIIDTTTGAPDQIQSFGERLRRRGVQYLDATVGGSSKQARAGNVIVIAGGDADVFTASQDLISSFARQSFHVGPCGNGARMKLVLNLVLGLNRAVLAEGLAFAKSSGLDPRVALEILKAGPAYSRPMDTKGDKMLQSDFSTEARLSQHLKDVRLMLAAGEQNAARLPFSKLHGELLEQLDAAGWGDADNSAIIKAFE